MSKEEQLRKAFDGATVSGKLITLNEEQATTFIDQVVDQSKMLQSVRIEKMSKPVKTIAKLLDAGNFLKPSLGRSLSEVDGYNFGSETLELVSKEVTGNIMIFDQDIQDNIEGAGVTNKLLGAIQKKIGNELEYAGIMGIKKGTTNELVDMFDGYRKRILDNGNVVDANSAILFPGAQRTITKDKFVRAYKSLPTKFRTPGVKFYSGSDTIIDYDMLFDSSYNRSEMLANILGRPHVDIPLMPIDLPVVLGGMTTTTTTASLKGQKILNVADSLLFTPGAKIVVGLGTVYQMSLVVLSTAAGVIEFTENLTQDIPAGLGINVQDCIFNGTDSIIGDGNNMIYGIQTSDMSFETYRVPNKGYRYFFKMRLDFQVEEPKAAVILKNLRNS